MNIQTAAKYMDLGYRIRRSEWPQTEYIAAWHDMFPFSFDEILADDWGIITENIIREFPIVYGDDK